MVTERRAAASLLRGLHRKGLPCIEIPPTQISVLRSPSDFYAELLAGAAAAQRRIALASLYVGDGARERELVCALQNAPAQTDIHLLLDGSRMQRGGGLALLAPLARRAGARVSLFRPPSLVSHSWRAALPPLANEVLGVQHAKACVFDDTVVLTGANLSAEYFERRQDRYVVIRDAPALADVVCGVLAAVGARSTAYDPDGAAATVEHLGGADQKTLWPPPPADGVGEAQALASAVNAVVRAAADAHPPPAAGAAPPGGCWVLPAVQCAPAGLTTDADATEWLLRRNTKLPLALSSPYLNPPPAYERAMLAAARGGGAVELACAAPQASGFWGAGGVRALVPQVYSHLEQQLARRAAALGAALRVRRYQRPGWTYHAKGLWLGAPPLLSVVGSSNFGERSVRRDLELSFTLVTTDASLSAELQAELDALRDHAVDADADDATEHTPSLAARAAAAAFRTFF